MRRLRPNLWMLLLLASALGCGSEDLVLPDEGDPSRIVLLAGDGQEGIVGRPLDDSIVVRVTDATGRPVHDVPVSVNLLDGGAVAPLLLRTDPDGRVAFAWTLGATAGPQQLVAGIGNNGGSNPTTSVDATARPGPVNRLMVVSGNDQVGQTGQTLPESLVARAEDGFGNPLPGVMVQWLTSDGSLAPSSGPTGPTGRVASSWRLGPAPSTQQATARVTLGGAPIDANFTATALAGPPPQLSILTQPAATAVSGVPLSPQPALQLRDASGAPLATAGVPVTASVTAGTATLGGATTVTTDAQGRAGFTNLSLSGVAGSHTLTFTAPGYLAVTSAPIVLSAATPDPSSSTIAASPGTLPVGGTSTITVTVRSGTGAPIPGVSVTLNATGSGNTLTQPSAPTNSSGVATGFLSSTVSGTKTVTATVGGQAVGGSVPVTFQNAGVAIFSIVSGDGQQAQVGTALPAPVVVRGLDLFGNPVPGLTVQWQPAQGQASPSSSVTDATGTAQASWTLGPTPGPQTLTARVAVGTLQLSATFNATALTTFRLALATQPADTAIDGVALSRQPVVQLEDGNGAPVAQSGVAVSVTVASGGASLSGTTTVGTDAQGIARFTGLVLSGSPGTQTLGFAASGFLPVTSAPVELITGPPSPGNSSFTVQPDTVPVDVPIIVTATVRSASGQPVSGVQVTISSSGGNNTITQPPLTDLNGQAVGSVSSTKAEDKTISVKLGGTAIGTGVKVVVVAGPADPATTTASVPNGSEDRTTRITITTRDQYGNRLQVGGLGTALQVTILGTNSGVAQVQDRNDGTYLATYTPDHKGTDLIFITINGVQISGSPYVSDVK